MKKSKNPQIICEVEHLIKGVKMLSTFFACCHLCVTMGTIMSHLILILLKEKHVITQFFKDVPNSF
jgi:hypothetical protein